MKSWKPISNHTSFPASKAQANPTTRILHRRIMHNYYSPDLFYATRIVKTTSWSPHATCSTKLPNEPSSSGTPSSGIHEFRAPFRLFERMLRSEIRPDNFTSAAWPDKTLRVVHVKVVFPSGSAKILITTARSWAVIRNRAFFFCEARHVFRGINELDLVLMERDDFWLQN
ncbi:Unknown protein [Striga hermonthica]|uniref:Uncharacterized protein n=1 Tax=Striga hermonthica TaxID=68872 RepID=A0A9N7NAX7_STRHE|nr:Unknown protein [Striga hermonthica]